jgi:tripartite-type tricarboxylate transporter receptor subunit TctC
MVNVPYRGDPHVDLLGRQVDVYFSPMPASIEYIKAGKLHGLAVTTATRSEALTDMPTVDEFVPRWRTHRHAGRDRQQAQQRDHAGLADPKIKEQLADLGGTVLPGSPADFGKLIAEETEKWAKVIRAANIKPE